MEKVLRMLEEIRPEFDFRNSSNFIQNGFLDSLDIITLVSMLDEYFHISINGTDIIPENFEDIESINKLILKGGGTL
ncbi:phosphopantetheine-binding protein [Neobacillus drentensis]|uniref:phosphopantetheine-binding protein n=1 Tax=Neobacillus drentensis TaxID=220684 RepID=UPI000825F109|nr:acyl carrier protein [Neobacillus drentensis]